MKTLETLKNECNTISKQIEQIGLDNKVHFVIDGIIEPEKYLNAKYHIKENNLYNLWHFERV